MVRKSMLFLLLLGAAAAGPMLMSGQWENLKQGNWPNLFGKDRRAELLASIESGGDFTFGETGGLGASTVGPAIDQAFRFDISPQDITTHWAEVTKVSCEKDWNGLRVPLVTGSQPTDLVGSLTYYFDRRQEVQRISFQGLTGNPAAIIQHVVEKHGFQNSPQLGASLYLTQWNGEPKSVLLLGHTFDVQTPAGRQAPVTLEINRATDDWSLSPALASQVKMPERRGFWQKKPREPKLEAKPVIAPAAPPAERVRREPMSGVHRYSLP